MAKTQLLANRAETKTCKSVLPMEVSKIQFLYPLVVTLSVSFINGGKNFFNS